MSKTHGLDFLGQYNVNIPLIMYVDLNSETLITRNLGLNVADENYWEFLGYISQQ